MGSLIFIRNTWAYFLIAPRSLRWSAARTPVRARALRDRAEIQPFTGKMLLYLNCRDCGIFSSFLWGYRCHYPCGDRGDHFKIKTSLKEF